MDTWELSLRILWRIFYVNPVKKLYYLHKDSGLELDFLVRFKGECVILEIKAKTGKSKSMTTVLKNKDVYHVKNAIKLGQYNVGREGDILTIPLYMGFLVNDKLADVIIPDVDVGLLNVNINTVMK